MCNIRTLEDRFLFGVVIKRWIEELREPSVGAGLRCGHDEILELFKWTEGFAMCGSLVGSYVSFLDG